MEKLEFKISRKRKLGTVGILLYCFAITLCVIYVLFFAYVPELNSPKALGSMCMDIVSMIVLMIPVISITFEKGPMGRTTKLFLALSLGTKWALFFDFLTWSFDGSLVYGEWTYWCTVASLCSGAMLACIFVSYLCSYMMDMYELTSLKFSTKVCVFCNIIAFVLTVILALTKNAFVFVDGHYQLGALYNAITVLPILTLIYMTIYVICHIKTIGRHDVISVVVYILIMIVGAVVESIMGFGATYVSITIADVFIYAMLQDRIIDREKKQKEILAEKMTSQYAILESMAGIYSYVNYVDLKSKSVRRFDLQESISEKIDLNGNPHTNLNKALYNDIEEDMREKFWEYTDLSTLPERMKSEKIITAEFIHKKEGWFRAQYIRIGETMDEPISKVIYAIRNIDEEKKNVEKWIKKSNTDEVTGFFNRHAYEDEIAVMEADGIDNNFVYISMDVNELKIVNDTEGHNAGDELIIGACECMRRVFGEYGKLYRTGGDEFAALIKADTAKLKKLLKEFETVTEKWRGKHIESLAVSYGYVTRKEAKKMSLHQMAVLADKRMYENKTEYYQKKGLDRRGQKDAHVALCALYNKILKININDDTYQIENINEDEVMNEIGFNKSLAKWLNDFGNQGGVHPDDLEEYLAKTNLEYLSQFFKDKKQSLRIFYRRKYNDEYLPAMMEIIPANDYRDDSQNLYLYVKNIEKQ